MKNVILLFSMLLFASYTINAQIVVYDTLYPTQDATVSSLYPDSNFGQSEYFTCTLSNVKPYPYIERSFMQFDLSAVPSDAPIVSARLYLFGLGHSGRNESFLNMVKTPWQEMLVTEKNQPELLDYRITLPQSTSSYEDYVVEIREFVTRWISGLEPNNGVALRLAAVKLETVNGLKFGSREMHDPTKRPYMVLRVEYQEVPKTTISSNLCFATDLPLKTQITADKVYKAEQYEFMIFNQTTGNTDIITTSSNSFNLTDMPTPVGYNTVYDIQVRVMVGGKWGSFGEKCRISTVKMAQAEPCDTTMLSHQFSGVDGGVVSIAVPSGITLLNSASVNSGTVSVNLIDPHHAEYTCNNSSFTLYYSVVAGCETFDKNTHSIFDTLQYSSSGTPISTTDSFSVTSPWINYFGNLSQNIQYNDAFINQQVTRTFAFINTGDADFSGDFEFIDTLNVNIAQSALRFDTIYSLSAATVTQTITDSSAYLKLSNVHIAAGDTMYIEDVVTLINCPDGANNITRFTGNYGCSGSSLCANIEIDINTTLVNESPDDKPILNYTLLTKGYPECWNEQIERIIKIENVGLAAADTIKIVYFPDMTTLYPNLLTIQPFDSITMFRKDIAGNITNVPFAIVNITNYNPVYFISGIAYGYYIIPQITLAPGDSVFMRYVEMFSCVDSSDIENHYNAITSMNVHEFPLINLIHKCNPTGFKFISQYPTQSDYNFTYSYQHFSMLNQVFENYTTMLMTGDSAWFQVHGDNFSIANPYYWQTQQLGFISDPKKMQLKIDLTLEGGLSLASNNIYLEADYDGAIMQLFADSIIAQTSDPCNKIYTGYFSMPDTFFVASPDSMNGFIYLPRIFNIATHENCFDEFFEDFYVKFKLWASSCSCPGFEGAGKITESFSLIPNEECPEKCAIPLAKVSDQILITCPGCILPGWNVSAFTISRTNIGFEDENNNNFPDSYPMSPANPSSINYHRAMLGDTLQFDLAAFISDGGLLISSAGDTTFMPFEGLGFDLIYGQMAFNNSCFRYLRYIGGDILFSDENGTYNLSSPHGEFLSSTDFVLNLDIDSLHSYGLPTTVDKYWRGQLIQMSLSFVIDSNFIDQSAIHPYMSPQDVNVMYNMSGTPFTGINIKTDANILAETPADSFLNMTPSQRAELSYWCVAGMARFTGVGVDIKYPYYSPFVEYYDGFMQSKSPCTNVIHFHAYTEVGHEVYIGEHNGDQNTWNAFAYEIRNLWMLDSMEVSFPPSFSLDSIIFINTQLTNTGGLTHYTTGLWSGCSWHKYDMSDTTMLNDTTLRIYPNRNFDEITFNQLCQGIPNQPLFGYDEIKRYRIFFILSSKDCAPPSATSATGKYPVTTYWSNFPGARNPGGDTVLVQPMKFGAYTHPDATLDCHEINTLVQDQQNSSLKFDLEVGTEANGYSIYQSEIRYQHQMSDNTFIGFQSPNFSVDSVVGVNSYSWWPIIITPGQVPFLGNIGSVSIYKLGLVSTDVMARKLRIFGHYNCNSVDQETDSIKVFYGWSCNGYPSTSVYDGCFLDSMWVRFNVANPGLQAVLDTISSVGACDTIEYTMHITATGTGQIDSLLIKLPLTGSFGYIPGSGFVTYNSNTAAVPESITPDTVFFYPGQMSLLDNFETSSCDFTFKIVPHCGFLASDDEVQLYTSAQNYCGKPLGPIYQADRPDEILGLPQHDSLIVQITCDTISGCGDTVHIVVTVYNAGTQNTSLADYTDIVLPAGFVWAGGDVPSGVAGQVLTFALSGNTAPGNSDNLNFTITGNVSAGNYSLPAAVYSVQTLICNSDTCYFTQAFAEDADTAEIIVIPLSLSTTTNDASCINACNGNSTAIVSGLAPFTYQWSNGDNTSTADSLCVGTYYLTVSDINGCFLIDTVSVSGGNTGNPDPFFTVSSDYPCLQVGNFLSFNCPDTNVTSWFWDFGDGTTSTLQNPTHMYYDFGYFYVNLDISGPCGISTINIPVYIQSKDCSCDTIEYNYTGVTIINSTNNQWTPANYPNDIYVEGDVIVPSGMFLHINSVTVKFAPNGRLIIEDGARLHLELSTLTGINPCTMWQGVEVWGNTDSASTSAVQGGVDGKFNSIINAHIGVLCGKRIFSTQSLTPFDLSKSGGWINLGATQFINNGIGIKYTAKNNKEGSRNNLYQNSFVCTILADPKYSSSTLDHYPNVQNPWNATANIYQRTDGGIIVEDLSGFNIYNGTFRNAQNGILSFDSKYNVFECDFRRMIYGIRIENTTTSVDNRHEIANCTFDSIPGVTNAHGCGIRIRGGRFDYVHDNEFGYQQNLIQSLNSISIRTDDANSFKIGENQFYNFKTGIYVRNTGLNSSYVGALGPIWNGNQYYQVRTNIQTIGNNSKLKLKCNMCNNPSSTLYQVNFNNSNGQLSQQGSPAPPFGSTNFKMKFGAGNEFAPPITGRKRIESVTPYNYYRQSNPSAVIPETYTSTGFINVHPISSSYIEKTINSVACPSPFGVITAELVLNLQVFPFKVLDSLDEANEVLKLTFDQRNAQLDGNATGELLADIYSDPPPGQLKNTLLAHSPLSDTVLIALIDHFPLSVGDYKTVMLANLPVSDHVAPWFYERLLLLPPGIDQQLVAAQAINNTAICPTAIEREMKENTINRGLWQNDLIITLTDTLNNNRSTAITLLERDTAVASRQVLAGTYLMEADFTKANGKLDTIALTTTVLDEWVNFTQLLGQKYSGGENLYDLDSAEIEYIRELAYACPENSATPFAQSVLYLLFREETPDCDEFETRSLLSNTSTMLRVKDDVCDATVYSAWPSPASDKVQIPYSLPEGLNGYLFIADMSGRDIVVVELQEGLNTLELDIRNYPEGTYYYGFRSAAGNCRMNKLVIIH